MFAVKQIGARGPLRTSDRAVSLCDVPATISDAVGIGMTQPFGCESVRGTQRKLPRMHYDYFESPRQKHFSRAKRFRFKFSPVLVDGHSWDRNSWVRCRPGCEKRRAVAR